MTNGCATQRAAREAAERAARGDVKRRGAILGLVLIVMLALGLLGSGLFALTSTNGMEAGRAISAAQAFWAAEAGAEHMKALAQRYRKPLPTIPYAGSPTGFLWGSNVLSGTTSHGAYSVDVMDDPAWANASHALKKYVIRSRATSAGGASQVVTLCAAIQSYASYMHASNYERLTDGTPIYFGPGDVIDGPVYVNDQLNICGGIPDPRFLQPVSSATDTVHYIAGATSSVFEAGLTLNATPLDVSGQFSSDHIQNVRLKAQAGGLVLSGNYSSFTFDASGSFTYQPAGGGPTYTNYLAALNGAIYVAGYVSNLSGAVNGNVTLAVQDSIYLGSNLVYASAVSPDPWNAAFNPANVDDSLGLIASNRVQILGQNPISIHAAIMITSGDDGFGAQQWNQSFGHPSISLFGGLTQYRRGLVGQTNGNGFRKNYRFDPRFMTDAPPFFPYSVYVFSRWMQSGGG